MWRVPRSWGGESAFILGGGPSLARVDVAALRGHGRVVAINDAGLVTAPWADVHYFADKKWVGWNRGELHRFEGQYRVTRRDAKCPGVDVKVLGHDMRSALSGDPGKVAGWCGGANALNLAYLFGAAAIVLFGFDMRPGSAFSDRRPGPEKDLYRSRFIPALRMMADALRAQAVPVANATPGSALDCFPIITPEEAPAWLTSAR